MPKKDLFEEKLALIYEYNRKSPLFVRAAGIEIEHNNLHKAVSIIKGGLAEYPNYPTAYILLGKALMLLGSFEEAEEAFKKGSGLIHSKETLNFYSSELEKRRRKSSNLTEGRRVSFLSDDIEIVSEEEVKPDEASAGETPMEDSDKPSSMEERLDDLAKEISSAKISITESQDENLPDYEDMEENTDQAESAIASETLARIYISQGKFSEALAMYRTLLRNSPEKKDIYQPKIDEIEQHLGTSGW